MLSINRLATSRNIRLSTYLRNVAINHTTVHPSREDFNRGHLIVIADLYLSWNLFVDPDRIPSR